MNDSSSGLAMLLELEAAAVEVRIVGGKVVLVGPTETLTADLLARVALAKSEIIAARAGSPVAHDAHYNLEQHCGSRTVGGSAANEGSDVAPCISCASEHIFVAFEPERAETAALERTFACAAHLPPSHLVSWKSDKSPPAPVVDALARGGRVISLTSQTDARRVLGDLVAVEGWTDAGAIARLARIHPTTPGLAAAALGVRDLPALTATPTHVAGSAEKRARLQAVVLRRSWTAHLHEFDSSEPDVREVDAKINARGFVLHRELAEAIALCEHRLVENARQAAGSLAYTIHDSERLHAHLRRLGLDLADVRKETLLRVLDQPDTSDEVRRIVLARLASSGISGHKARAALRSVDGDDRVRGSLLYCQAHTGRWSGRGFQPQNLPRGADFKDESGFERAVDAALRRDLVALDDIARLVCAPVHEVLASLVRGCIRAPERRVLGIADYRSIEPRALLWLAGDEEGLSTYRPKGSTPYEDAAARLLEVERARVSSNERRLGKSLELGCGYQLGGARLHMYAEALGVDWSTLSITANEAVTRWRSSHPLIAGTWDCDEGNRNGYFGGIWQRLEDAAFRALGGEQVDVGPVTWLFSGGHLICILPSGRPLIYRNARIDRQIDARGRENFSITYDHGGRRASTYGGKLTENVVQAICRDLLAAALVRLEKAGFEIVLHVHDELVAELFHPSELTEFAEMMCEVPDWAGGLPLEAESFTSARYRK